MTEAPARRPLDVDAVPELADLVRFLEAHHPLVLAAVADVDRSLIWAMQERSPMENLVENFRHARGLERLREAVDRRTDPPTVGRAHGSG